MAVTFVCLKQKLLLNFISQKEVKKQCIIISSNSPTALETKREKVIIPEKRHELSVSHDELGKTETDFLLCLVKRRETSAALAQFPVFRKEKGKLAQLQKFQKRKVFRKLKLLLPHITTPETQAELTILATAYVTPCSFQWQRRHSYLVIILTCCQIKMKNANKGEGNGKTV